MTELVPAPPPRSACAIALLPVPPEATLPTLLSEAEAAFPCPAASAYIRALSGDGTHGRVTCERVGAFALLPRLLHAIGVATQELYPVRDAHGRPYLTAADQRRPADINLSHSRAYVAGACVAAPHRVGVDVEEPVPPARAEKLTARYLSAAEQAILAGATPLPGTPITPSPARFCPDFTCLWTMREAISKYMGTGEPLRFDASRPPRGVRLIGGHLPVGGTRLTLCLSGAITAPPLLLEHARDLSVDFDLLIP